MAAALSGRVDRRARLGKNDVQFANAGGAFLSDEHRRTAAILGGGTRGAGWAARFLLHGWDVALFDPDPAAAGRVHATLDAARAVLPALCDAALPAEGALRFASRISETVAAADWIAECAPERIDFKRKLYQQVQAHCPAGAIIASASGRFTASALQACATRPEQIVLAHPGNPAYLVPLVELSGGEACPAGRLSAAAELLRGIGMLPVTPAAEAEGNIAGRLAEALWREALWLVAEGIATPRAVDMALAAGPALGWAQGGLFASAAQAGGEGGMAAALDGVRIDLGLPRSHLTDLPPFDDALAARLVAAVSDAPGPADRDRALAGILRALKDRRAGAGAALADAEARRAPALHTPRLRAVAAPLLLGRMEVLPAWIDANGHMTESRYLFVCSETTDAFLRAIGADADHVASGFSYYTVETHLRHLAEAHAGEALAASVQILAQDPKRLHLFVRILRDNVPLATVEQILLHVDTRKRHAVPAPQAILDALAPLAAAHAGLPWPEGAGRHVGQPRG